MTDTEPTHDWGEGYVLTAVQFQYYTPVTVPQLEQAAKYLAGQRRITDCTILPDPAGNFVQVQIVSAAQGEDPARDIMWGLVAVMASFYDAHVGQDN